MSKFKSFLKPKYRVVEYNGWFYVQKRVFLFIWDYTSIFYRLDENNAIDVYTDNGSDYNKFRTFEEADKFVLALIKFKPAAKNKIKVIKKYGIYL